MRNFSLATIHEISRQALKKLLTYSSIFFEEYWPSKHLKNSTNIFEPLRKFATGWSNTWLNIYAVFSFLCMSLAVIIDRNFHRSYTEVNYDFSMKHWKTSWKYRKRLRWGSTAYHEGHFQCPKKGLLKL